MRIKFTLKFILLILVTLALGAILASCKTKQPARPKKVTTNKSEEVSVNKEGGKKVLMLGRSVLGGWFGYWGSDTSTSVEREGFTLYYRELNTPPEIVSSAREQLNQFSDKHPIVFFKLCFDDFQGGSRAEARNNLVQNKKYAEQVYNIVVEERGLKLIIGNALPKVKAYTDPDLVWNHRQYNSWLNNFANHHPGQVYIFDQYNILSDGSGNLKAEFASSPEDSHPNNSGYSALDRPFFKLLKTNF